MHEFFMTLQQEIVSHAGTDAKQLYFYLNMWTKIKGPLKQKKKHSLSAVPLSGKGKAKLLQQENGFVHYSNPSASIKGQTASCRQQSAVICHLSEGR